VEPLTSTLHKANGGGLEKLVLEMISCGRLKSDDEVKEFVKCTLMTIQQPVQLVQDYTNEVLTFLRKEHFVPKSRDGSLSPSPLGKATTLSGISPKDVMQIIHPLLKARSKLILKGGLHPVFLITPPDTRIEPDWANYRRIVDDLYRDHPEAKDVAAYLEVDNKLLDMFVLTPPPYGKVDATVSFYRRFYSSILLFILIQETPLSRVTNLMAEGRGINRGQYQQLQKDAAAFCGMTVVFCQTLNWSALASCLDEFTGRLSYGVHRDLLPLVRLGPDVITSTRGRHFFKQGVCNAEVRCRETRHSMFSAFQYLSINSVPENSKCVSTT
jgi:hypothetical protein